MQWLPTPMIANTNTKKNSISSHPILPTSETSPFSFCINLLHSLRLGAIEA
jgi:hypothetical protein